MKSILTLFILLVVLIFFAHRGKAIRLSGSNFGGRAGFGRSRYYGGPKGGDIEGLKNYGGRRSFEGRREQIRHLEGYQTDGRYHP